MDDDLPVMDFTVFLNPSLIFQSVACGKQHSLALTTTGVLYEWGWLEQEKFSNVPEEIKHESKFVEIDCGMQFKAALTRKGELYAWGNNDYGQCGTGSTGDD